MLTYQTREIAVNPPATIYMGKDKFESALYYSDSYRESRMKTGDTQMRI